MCMEQDPRIKYTQRRNKVEFSRSILYTAQLLTSKIPDHRKPLLRELILGGTWVRFDSFGLDQIMLLPSVATFCTDKNLFLSICMGRPNSAAFQGFPHVSCVGIVAMRRQQGLYVLVYSSSSNK